MLPHPDDPSSVTAALSTGGVYQTSDGGASWEPRNQGIRAEFLPEGQQYPEFGQCVHKVTRHPSRPERLFLQNHGGVYRSDDHGATWQSIADGLPAEFGFSDRGRTPTSPTPSTSSRSTAATGATRRTARRACGARATPATRGRSSARACPTTSTSR